MSPKVFYRISLKDTPRVPNMQESDNRATGNWTLGTADQQTLRQPRPLSRRDCCTGPDDRASTTRSITSAYPSMVASTHRVSIS